jgi:hypothetical protein
MRAAVMAGANRVVGPSIRWDSVVYVDGDSHYFRIDKPLENSAGQRLENFTRLETFGDHQENGNNDVNWVKVLVDASSREVFSFQPQTVPANRTAVPAP